mmetsp:Transcript_31113/g.99511  ORF Transcript_31113/g.99511 Transcript_31113/m.99511 type:complete len:246 (-) Transcript_31113:128-865(-)
MRPSTRGSRWRGGRRRRPAWVWLVRAAVAATPTVPPVRQGGWSSGRCLCRSARGSSWPATSSRPAASPTRTRARAAPPSPPSAPTSPCSCLGRRSSQPRGSEAWSLQAASSSPSPPSTPSASPRCTSPSPSSPAASRRRRSPSRCYSKCRSARSGCSPASASRFPPSPCPAVRCSSPRSPARSCSTRSGRRRRLSSSTRRAQWPARSRPSPTRARPPTHCTHPSRTLLRVSGSHRSDGSPPSPTS